MDDFTPEEKEQLRRFFNELREEIGFPSQAMWWQMLDLAGMLYIPLPTNAAKARVLVDMFAMFGVMTLWNSATDKPKRRSKIPRKPDEQIKDGARRVRKSRASKKPPADTFHGIFWRVFTKEQQKELIKRRPWEALQNRLAKM